MHSNYGMLLNEQDIKLQRKYFEEMCRMIGVRVLHRSPMPGKTYTTYAEVDSTYYPPEDVGCIFEEHPNQKTMRKLGWNSELSETASLISVPYDVKGLQKGSLFILPSAFDGADPRLFRVTEISGIMIYPCSLTCQLVPEFINTFSNTAYDYHKSSFNLLNREDEA